MNGSDVQTTLREMWDTRPERPRHDRKIAGVAAAIARRYDLDPVLVRVGFAVSAFYGIGILLYIAGWVVLPDEGSPRSTSPGQSRSSPHPVLLIVFAIAIVAAIGGVFHDIGHLLAAAAVFGLLFLLHRSRADRGIPGGSARPAAPTGPAAGQPAQPPAAGAAEPGDGAGGPVEGQSAQAQPPAEGTEGTDGTQGADDPTVRVNPPAWDPLGAAPFAWDLPEPAPAPAPVPERRRRSRVTPVALALAVLAGGVTALVMLLGWGSVSLPVLFATVLAVLGSGLLVGSFIGGGRGLIPFALLLSLMTWASLAVPLNVQEGVGDIRVAPRTAAELAPTYTQGAGSIELDLRQLDLTSPAGTDALPIRTSADVGTGVVEVYLPPNADVTVNGRAGFGHVAVGTIEDNGPDSVVNVTDLGADGVRSGPMIELDLRTGLGAVEVHRG